MRKIYQMVNFACLRNCLLMNTRTVIIKMKREYFYSRLENDMQEASKRRCNKIKLLSLSFVSKSTARKILIIIFLAINIFFKGTASPAERCGFAGMKLGKVHELFQVFRIWAKGVAKLYGLVWLIL